MGAVVIIDEAYHYFYDKTFLNYVKQNDNVIILRTFSKLFSIAACRLGVIIGTPEIINYVRNAKLTFDVNAVALLFGEKLLEHPDIIRNLIETEKKERNMFLQNYEIMDMSVVIAGGILFCKAKA